jgi:hypothetical protein
MIGFVGQGSGFGRQGSGVVVKDLEFGGQGMDVWWPRNGCLVVKDRVLWPMIGFDDQGLG